MFDAIVFAVMMLGFKVRCALERETATEERLSKILQMIDECPFAIHDLSFMQVDKTIRLPRYNMTLELGLFLGMEFRQRNRTRSCLILDKHRFRYLRSISDLRGRDIKAHNGRVAQAVTAVRDWLATENPQRECPGAHFVTSQYARFRKQLPRLCQEVKLHKVDLTFNDYSTLVAKWLQLNP
jgi:hypothetical protein